VLTDDGVVELLDGADGACELVGTTLNNPAMPLRRYRTGDRGLPGSGAPCPCGRVFPTVQSVIGRQERCVRLPDGQVLYANDNSFRVRVVAGLGFRRWRRPHWSRPSCRAYRAWRWRSSACRLFRAGRTGKFKFVVLEG
jgi:hypothetical protein